MKIDKKKLKKSRLEVHADLKALIEALKSCSEAELLNELENLKPWINEKCELYHWVDVLNICDSVLERACQKENESSWVLACDLPENKNLIELLYGIFRFTTLLVQRSSNPDMIYNSTEHLISLLSSVNFDIISHVLSLLHALFKSGSTSNLPINRRSSLRSTLGYLAENWGGVDSGLGLAECCKDLSLSDFPPNATDIHYEFKTKSIVESPGADRMALGGQQLREEAVTVIDIKLSDWRSKSLVQLIEKLIPEYDVPVKNRTKLYFHIRKVCAFPVYETRIKYVCIRLQALLILVNTANKNGAKKLIHGETLSSFMELISLPRNMSEAKIHEVHALAVQLVKSWLKMDINAFKGCGGLQVIVDRLGVEVDACRKEQPHEIRPPSPASIAAIVQRDPLPGPLTSVTCPSKQAYLLECILDFLKNSSEDTFFSDSIRDVVDRSLAAALKHIISNPDYYGKSLFLLGMDVVEVFFKSSLSTFQNSGLTDVFLHALPGKGVSSTIEVLLSLPYIFGAFFETKRGLSSCVTYKPFLLLFSKVFLSPDYLPALNFKRSNDDLYNTATAFGNVMRTLVFHQASLLTDTTAGIIKLLKELCSLGHDRSYTASSRTYTFEAAQSKTSRTGPLEATSGGSCDQDHDEETTSSSFPTPAGNCDGNVSTETKTGAAVPSDKTCIPLGDYVHNALKFIDAFLSSNFGGLHCREFVTHLGLYHLMLIFGLPNLPVDFSDIPVYQAVGSVWKSTLKSTLDPQVFQLGLSQLLLVLLTIQPLHKPLDLLDESVLLRELSSCANLEEALRSSSSTPLLRAMASVHGYITMLIDVCQTRDSGMRSLSINQWGSSIGKAVLEEFSSLLSSLIRERIVLSNLDRHRRVNLTRAQQHEMKMVEYLLSTTSRLGRKLAELVRLLILLRVDSTTPLLPTPSTVSMDGLTSALNQFLSTGLRWKPPVMLPSPKIHLTLRTWINFTSLMLFEEKKVPCHIMLHEFVSCGGQAAFLDAFNWVLSASACIQLGDGLEYSDLPGGNGEFLVEWLVLLEKMVNPKNILNFPQQLTNQALEGSNLNFSPSQFLVIAHRQAIAAVSKLWGMRPLKGYGDQMTESVLTILWHILKSEVIIHQRLADEQLHEAMLFGGAEAASNLGSSTTTLASATSTTVVGADVAVDADMTVSTSAPTSAGKKSKDEDPRDVYALSLRTLKEMATGSTATAEIEALSIDMDSFFQNTLPGCLALMDDFPSSADRVCSLVEAVVKRNGESFRVDMLAALASENSSSSSKLQEYLSKEATELADEEDVNNFGLHTRDHLNQPDDTGRVLVNVDHPSTERDIFLPDHLSKVAKSHQIGGIRFLYDIVAESKEQYGFTKGNGCILAHSKRLGKTFLVCAFTEAFLRNMPAKKVLIITTDNKIQHWLKAFNHWLPTEQDLHETTFDPSTQPRDFTLYEVDSTKDFDSQLRTISDWSNGRKGVLLISYKMYGSFYTQRETENKKGNPWEKSDLERIYLALVDPGPDLVIYDKGHRIKRTEASIVVALEGIRTRRRVVLTSHPLKNNLLEYWYMVNLVLPDFLGPHPRFRRFFVSPIPEHGIHSPATLMQMEGKVYIFHSLVKNFVQRRSLASESSEFELSTTEKCKSLRSFIATSIPKSLKRRKQSTVGQDKRFRVDSLP